MQSITRECPNCLQTKIISQFRWRKAYSGDHYGNCISCEDAMWEEINGVQVKTPRVLLWERSKINALESGIEHTISLDDIPLPNTCRYLGIVLEYPDGGRLKGSGKNKQKRWSANTASLDRIDSAKGYVPGNVQTISWLANKMKSDATVEQLLMFARGVLRVHGSGK